uniref:CD80 antigen n=1 Tax=Mus spicilegus TaxID=10103 RepID=A0A8C6HHP9_MUSSI
MACNCQLMQDTPLLKFPCLRLILLFVLLIRLSQASSDVDEQLSKSVKDKVLLPCRYNSPHEDESEDRIYWQKHDKVVLSVIAGKLKVWPEYKNRTLYDNTTHSLIILGLVLSDRGTYSCVVQKKERGTYEVKHLALVKLSIKAPEDPPDSENTLVLFGAGFGAVITVVVIVVIIKCFCKHRSCFRRNEASRETNNSLTFGPEEALAEQTVFL